jgi:cell division protein FtsZ
MSIQFDLPKEQSSIIKVIGVGGGGSNAVNHMYKQGIAGVDFIICNTDAQALDLSPVPNKVQLGATLTEGRGAGMNPEIGKQSALESLDKIKMLLEKNTKMLFITAGMGKGTGTGGAPVIAALAREMGILTVGLVTTPFSYEGPKRFQQAMEGINEIKKHVDTILVVSNDKLREIYGNLKLTEAFSNADSILTNAAKSIAEIITLPGHVNVDFEDVRTVMQNSGVAIMGTSACEGEQRALNAVEQALTSPLLMDNDIKGAKNILVNITSGNNELSVDELTEINEYIQREAGEETNIILGICNAEELGEKLSITIIATGFQSKPLARKNAKVENIEAPKQAAKEEPAAKTMPRTRTVRTHHIEKEETKLQMPLEFVLSNKEEKKEEKADVTDNTIAGDDMMKLVEKPEGTSTSESPMSQLHRERVNKLKDLSFKLNNQSSITELERQPAFIRRNIPLKDVPHSSESERSAYYLSDSDNPDKPAEIKKNNSFLHGQDKVD